MSSRAPLAFVSALVCVVAFGFLGKTVRVLAEENDKAFALLNTLDESQRNQAILNYRVDDLVAGPGHAGETIQPEGLEASAMNAK